MNNNRHRGLPQPQRNSFSFMVTEDFLDCCRPEEKEVSKLGVALAIRDFQTGLVKEYVQNIHNARYQELADSLYEKMDRKKFAKGVLTVIKDREEYPEGLDLGFAVIISAYLDKVIDEKEEGDEVVELYTEALHRLLEDRVTEIVEKTGVPEEVVLELLVIAPAEEYISSPKYIGNYVFKMLRKLYLMADSRDDMEFETPKKLRKLFKNLFSKEALPAIAINILLERKENSSGLKQCGLDLWNQLTSMALLVLEKSDHEEITAALESYCRRRRNDVKSGKDSARRIQLTSLVEKDYPKIYSVVQDLLDDEEFQKYL